MWDVETAHDTVRHLNETILVCLNQFSHTSCRLIVLFLIIKVPIYVSTFSKPCLKGQKASILAAHFQASVK